jgi:CubicO group peptidase (beta-lactamase class C family)
MVISQLPCGTPESQGISSASILRFVEGAVQNLPELHSFMLLRHGVVVAEGWWAPYAPQHPHMLFSLSKSFTSTGVGLAVMEGRLSVDDRVLDFFPEDAPAQPDANLSRMQVRHLLSMSTGHAEDTMRPLQERQDGNWTKAFLSLPVEFEPGTHFLYNTGASYMLSAIVQKVTGMKLLDYLEPRLFQPLGITGAAWEESPQGVNMGGFGLSIKTEDIARFGQLYLQKGMWNGRCILPAEWVEEATASQVENGSDPNSDWHQGYGYQFWRCRHGAFRGDGACGQFCVIFPEQQAVLAITAGIDNMQSVLDHVWDTLLPAMGPAPLFEDPESQRMLALKLENLAFHAPQGEGEPPIQAAISGQRYVIEANPMGFESVSFDFSDGGCLFKLKDGTCEEQAACGLGAWRSGTSSLFNHRPAKVMASGVWTAGDTFTMTLRFYETPFCITVKAQFQDSRVHLEVKMNVSFGPEGFPSLEGKAV